MTSRVDAFTANARPQEVAVRLRIVLADDERPAREFLRRLLSGATDVEIVGEAANGTEAVEMIERLKPDLALLDLQMPALDGLGVVRALSRVALPLVAFVTAFDDYAVEAFEANAIDYLLKPVEPTRLRRTLMRAHERLERADVRREQDERLHRVVAATSPLPSPAFLRRIPVRRRDDIVIVPVDQVAAIVADGELLQITTVTGERHTITHTLKELASRLDPTRFVRLSRGTLVNVDVIHTVSPMPGGTYVVTLKTKLQLPVSRSRARELREQLLTL